MANRVNSFTDTPFWGHRDWQAHGGWGWAGCPRRSLFGNETWPMERLVFPGLPWPSQDEGAEEASLSRPFSGESCDPGRSEPGRHSGYLEIVHLSLQVGREVWAVSLQPQLKALGVPEAELEARKGESWPAPSPSPHRLPVSPDPHPLPCLPAPPGCIIVGPRAQMPSNAISLHQRLTKHATQGCLLFRRDSNYYY